ncbi:MAG TPA: filamentous hemagglutinin N-terminal domain-containing protein, partial [Caldimonas sp.]|nr:filamentous hemagglutinin N-terminal domain-containing protein [Caldimonas sp.]
MSDKTRTGPRGDAPIHHRKKEPSPPALVIRLSRGRSIRITWRRPRVIARLTALLLASIGCFPLQALGQGRPVSLDSNALPTNGTVTSGAASIQQSGSRLNVDQSTAATTINWGSFNIGSGAWVNFNQPGANAVALNRVAASAGASEIEGRLTSNGQVFLLNPNGVLFGKTAQVDVGGLVASSLDISDKDFLAGKRSFTRNRSAGAVLNQGSINAVKYIALLAPEARNEGTLTARLGTVALGAGNKVTLDFAGDRLINLTVDEGALKALAENRQLIQADGGTVILAARAADRLAGTVVNNSGIIQARTIDNHGGVIRLLGGAESGVVSVGGVIDASASNGGDGGSVETSGANVTVADGTRVTTASAQGRTGTWLIDPHDFNIAASGGDISGSTLSSNLGSGNVTILSSSGADASGAGDINVNDAISWGANTLILTAARDININAVMTAAGSSKLTMNTATANGGDAAVPGGTVKVGFDGTGHFAGRVDFDRTGTGILTINGAGYTLINSVGVAGSTTGTDLQGIAGGLAGKFALGANIDASATSTWNSNQGFAPINSFTGVLDGLGHTVTGLTINRPSTYDVGVFGTTTNLTFAARNIGLEGGSVKGYDRVGALAGFVGGSVTNSYASASVTGSDAGGLVGQAYSSLTITNSHATGNVSGGSNLGGLAGTYPGLIVNSYATGNVSGSSSSVGGLVGYGPGIITNSYATGNVSTTYGGSSLGLGGLVGSINGSTITNSYATGSLTSPAA